MNGDGIFFFCNGSFMRSGFMNSKAEGVGYLHASEKEAFLMKFEDGVLKGEVTNFSIRKNRVRVSNFTDGKFTNIIKEYINYDESCRTNILLSVFEIGTQFMTELLENTKWMKDLEESFIGSFYLGDRVWFHGIITNGQPSGFGILHEEEGKIQMGKFNNGNLDGFGRIIFENGLIMDGKIKDNIFNGNVILHDFSTNEWKENIFENNKPRKEVDKGFGFPRSNLLKYRQHFYDNVVPTWSQTIQPEVIDNQVSKERLFYILYGLDYATSKNDLDFDWSSKTSDKQYRSDNSEGQLSFGDDKQDNRNDDEDYKDEEDMAILESKPEFGRVKSSEQLSEDSDRNDKIGFHEEKNMDNNIGNLKNSEAFTLGEASKDGNKNLSDVKNLNNLFNDVGNGFNIHSSPETDVKNNFKGLSLQESLQENDIFPQEKHFEKRAPTNVNNENSMSQSYGQSKMGLDWPSIFDTTDILILKRCFQRFDLNDPDVDSKVYNNKTNSRHQNRCVPSQFEVEKKCTTEAFQYFVNDYIARFMPQDELKKFISKSPLKDKNITIEETNGLTNKYRKTNEMKARGLANYDREMNRSYRKKN